MEKYRHFEDPSNGINPFTIKPKKRNFCREM